jgi:DNA topoisomerase-2
MSTIEEKYVFMSAEDSVIYKDWAAGSRQQIPSSEFVIRTQGSKYTATYDHVQYPPALMKIIDEPIVNAIDHYIRCLGTATPVTHITVNVADDGRIRVYNDGPGVEIALHKKASEHFGRDIWLPTFIFGHLFQGSNRNHTADSIIGGENGLGAKLSGCFALDSAVETVHGGKYFLQKWEDHKKVEKPPLIIDLTAPGAVARFGPGASARTTPHTLLSFMPDYVGLFGYESFDESVRTLITDLVRTRMFYAAAYIGYTQTTTPNAHRCVVTFNDVPIPVSSMADVAKLFFPGKPITTSIVASTARPPSPYKYAWEVCAVVTDATVFEVPLISNVNGVVVRDGKHRKFLADKIVEGVRERIAKIIRDKNINFAPANVTNNLFLFMNTKIPRPSWTGQRKDVLEIDLRKLAGYALDAKFINPVADALKDRILDSIFTVPAATGRKKTLVECDKYTEAGDAGGRYSRECILLCGEGDSALSQLAIGVPQLPHGWRRCGTISTGGVCINARTKCVVTQTPTGQHVKQTKQLQDNIFIRALQAAVGLNVSYKYDPTSSTYQKEMAELRYGHVVACVDQDLDGKGNILGLLLSAFDVLWPNLLKAGFVQWACTPIIRAYPKTSGKVIAFYSISEYDAWAASAPVHKYIPKYYKGLGTHSRDETISMFKTFNQHLYTYYVDDRSDELFEIYFGRNPDLRKRELSTPAKVLSAATQAEQHSRRLISCSDHLEHETREYQVDNLSRKLDHVIDGQNQSGRKVLDGLLKMLHNGKPLKVAQMAGYVSEHENYHHGEDSLGKTITGKGFVAVGGKQLPFLVPSSQFGTRLKGGDDAASPRYIHAHLNKNIVDLIFPPVDYWTLPFNFDEGERSEPTYFIPIIPMAILESTQIPAHGWLLKTWARDVFKVIDNVRRQIRMGDDVALPRAPPTTYKGSPFEWSGEIRTIRGEPYSFGRYTIDKEKGILVITELPLRVWNDTYLSALRKKQAEGTIIASISDTSTDITIEITIKLKPGAVELLDELGDGLWADGVEEYFMLRNHMYTHLNLMSVDGTVIMFDTYEEVMRTWFPVRREHYAARVNRARVLSTLRIRRMENTIRYVRAGFAMSKLKIDEMTAILSEQQFDKINCALLDSPKFTPTSDLETDIMLGSDANYKYLLGLSDLKKSAENLVKYEAALAKLREDANAADVLAGLGRFPGAAIWEAELDELEQQVRMGQATAWKYDDATRFVLD